MAPVKDLQLTYKTPNTRNVFSEGDVIVGAVTFTLTREIRVKSLQAKVKGGSHVSWEESSGMTSRRYRDHYEFFKVQEYLVAEKHEGMSIQRGMAAVTCFTILNTRIE